MTNDRDVKLAKPAYKAEANSLRVVAEVAPMSDAPAKIEVVGFSNHGGRVTTALHVEISGERVTFDSYQVLRAIQLATG